jgi:hypothetical protein
METGDRGLIGLIATERVVSDLSPERGCATIRLLYMGEISALETTLDSDLRPPPDSAVTLNVQVCVTRKFSKGFKCLHDYFQNVALIYCN